MIYPFTLVKISQSAENEWTLTVKVDEVVRYEASTNPAEEFRTPIIRSSELCYHVQAATEEEAMLEVARRVNS